MREREVMSIASRRPRGGFTFPSSFFFFLYYSVRRSWDFRRIDDEFYLQVI